MSETLYLRCRPGDVAGRVLLTGDPARAERIGGMLHQTREVARNREYLVVTGEYQGQQITAVSAGIGAPSTAIALEELAMLGVRAVVRLGTMMGVHAPLGSVVLSTGAARFEATSLAYLPPAYPAIPNWELLQTLAAVGRDHDLNSRLGLTVTHDAFYPSMAPELVNRGKLDLDIPRRAGVLALDMETSVVYVLGMVLGLAAASMCLVTVQAEPHAALMPDQRTAPELKMIESALDGLVKFVP
jgi:uridine phosphorylase